MDAVSLKWSFYLLPALAVLAYWRLRARSQARNRAVLRQAQQANLSEPASLHPLVNEDLCMACGSCVTACPEDEVLGLVDGRAVLINPSHCIGHGACKTACPFDAIELVFGSARRGVDIPHVGNDFQTNVPGIYIAGELGGMGLIRNAIEQGRRAMEAIARDVGQGKGEGLDVLIVGAGPAGFAATLAAKEKGLRYATIEQDSLGGTVYNFPRGKLVMTAPVRLPLVGNMKFRETRKETLLEFWQQIERRTGVAIRYHERMDAVVAGDGGFVVRTDKGEYRARAVLLAIGRRGTPRRLGVPGEDLPKVVYTLIDPQQYRGQRVLVVGGGDSALEAATSIAEQPDTVVAISYRSDSFSRAKEKNRRKVAEAEAAGRLRLLLPSNVKEIGPDRVVLELNGERVDLDNDATIICAGGILPTPMLKEIGIRVETKYGTA